MSGMNADVAAKILELKDLVLFTYCKMRSLNLSFQNAFVLCPSSETFYTSSKTLTSSSETHLVRQATQDTECAQTQIRPLCPT